MKRTYQLANSEYLHRGGAEDAQVRREELPLSPWSSALSAPLR